MIHLTLPLEGAALGRQPVVRVDAETACKPALAVAAEARPLPQRVGRSPTWLAAAGVALALHAGIALGSLWAMTPEESDDEIGAPAIEVSVEMAAPKAEDADAPPGPESTASAAAPDSAEARPQAEAALQPKPETIDAENPDLAAARDQQKQREEKPEENKPAPARASTASVAAEDTAAPRQDAAPPGPVARAPVIGPGRNAQKERASWQRRLVAHLDRHKRYPADGARREAQVEIRFALDPAGRVRTATLVRSSGSSSFDAAALDMMRRADPVPAPPDFMSNEALAFTVPVIFRADRK